MNAEWNGGAYNIVLVEVDKVENLKAAYPNYFGDVQLFLRNLRLIARGKEAREYTLPPQETVRPQELPATLVGCGAVAAGGASAWLSYPSARGGRAAA